MNHQYHNRYTNPRRQQPAAQAISETQRWRLAARMHLLSWCLVLFVAFHLAGCASVPPTPDHQLALNHHEFMAWDFVAKPGEQISITNQSDIAHSLYITSPAGQVVNLGVQLPGRTVYWRIPRDGAGDYLIQCWIHPIIRATLQVQGIAKKTDAAQTLTPAETKSVAQKPDSAALHKTH
ncbi:hypothetical protein [Methylobacillus glycogenes]|uniref:hypothetical protein n=1 Tax=Methylobacillus glycogenes TaxID=406 RepID=UPI0004707A3D|nr:hypothetical protein [Methylobacillus glycogenes]